jgi:hypothetical protein
MMRETRKGKNLTLMFDGVSEMLEYVERDTDMTYHNRESRKVASSDSWSGTKTWEDAVELARKGYSDVRAEVDELTAIISSRVSEVVDTMSLSRFDVTGGMVDVSRFVEGEPECMVDYVLAEAPTQGKVTTILMNAGYGCGVDSKAIFAQGAAVCALVEVLAQCGQNVELWVEMCGCADGVNKGSVASVLVKLKDARDLLDVNGFMFGVVHPAWFRRMMFAVGEQWNVEDRRRWGIGSYYFYPSNPQQGELVGADLVIGESQRLLRVSEYDAEWIVARLIEAGVDVG